MTTATPSRFEPFRRRVQEILFARLPEHGQRLRWSAEQIAAYQQERLRSLLAHAVAQSRFHARRLGGVEASRFEVADLARLPIMTKAEMMAAFDETLTDSRLSRQQVEETLARTGEVPIPLFDEYICQATGAARATAGSSSSTPRRWPISCARCCGRRCPARDAGIETASPLR